MKATFVEVLKFLSTQRRYMVIGSFAVNIWNIFPHSDDLDVIIADKKQATRWRSHFQARGWRVIRDELRAALKKSPVLTLKKRSTTFDIIFAPHTLRKHSVAIKKVCGYHVRVLAAEGIFLMKLRGALCHPERSMKKRVWDLKGALHVIDRIDQVKLLKLLKRVYPSIRT